MYGVVLHSPLIIYLNGGQCLCRGFQGHSDENKDKMVELLFHSSFYEVSLPEPAKAGVGGEDPDELDIDPLMVTQQRANSGMFSE